MKHRGEGAVIIDFITNDCSYPDNRRYDLGISDNGVGPPPGFSIKMSMSMALEIVTILTAQLEGALSAHLMKKVLCSKFSS